MQKLLKKVGEKLLNEVRKSCKHLTFIILFLNLVKNVFHKC